MKVILIKDCQLGKVNEIVEVKSGYATNFLFIQGIAEPLNKVNLKNLKKRIKNIEKNKESDLNSSLILKDKIEKITLEYKLESHMDKVHKAITTKQIIRDLEMHEININKFMIPINKINKIGINDLEVHLPQSVVANLKIVIKKDH